MKEAFINDLLSMIKKDDIRSIMDGIMQKINPYIYIIVFILIITTFTNIFNFVLLILLFKKINKLHKDNIL